MSAHTGHPLVYPNIPIIEFWYCVSDSGVNFFDLWRSFVNLQGGLGRLFNDKMINILKGFWFFWFHSFIRKYSLPWLPLSIRPKQNPHVGNSQEVRDKILKLSAHYWLLISYLHFAASSLRNIPIHQLSLWSFSSGSSCCFLIRVMLQEEKE